MVPPNRTAEKTTSRRPISTPPPPPIHTMVHLPKPEKVKVSAIADNEMSRLLAPPVNRTMRVLDRAFFKKTVSLSAARIFDQRNTTLVRKECKDDILRAVNIDPMRHDPDTKNYAKRKVVIMRPEVKHDDPTTATLKTQALITSKIIELIPFDLQLTYDNWDYQTMCSAILPLSVLDDDIPSSFAVCGHLAHMNLRTEFLPYKYLLAELVVDKSNGIKTVVNKVDDVGADSVFRTFPMELLAGEDNTIVQIKEADCRFTFDFAKVYWNTRLSNEHERIVAKFQPGEAVCDLMAGVGPFALPAGKKGVFVWANDLNPDSFSALRDNIIANKVQPFVTAFNEDAKMFIKRAIKDLYTMHCSPKDNPVVLPAEKPRFRKDPALRIPAPEPKKIPLPATFAHFVMNLPATAVSLLGAYRGCYQGLEKPFEEGKFEMPMIHVHTFHRETDESPLEDAERAICAEVSEALGVPMTAENVDVHDVRRVAPNKGMYCASFRLPEEVAFGDPMPPVMEDRETLIRKEEEKNWKKWTRDD